VPGGKPHVLGGKPFHAAYRGGNNVRRGRRPTIDHVVIGRAVDESTGFDKESMNRSREMNVLTMGAHTNFKQWKRNFLMLLSLKATHLIPQLAISESGVWLDEADQNYAYELLLHAANENKRVDQAVKCIYTTRHDCATAAWDILCNDNAWMAARTHALFHCWAILWFGNT
jgi:hypothetical protein